MMDLWIYIFLGGGVITRPNFLGGGGHLYTFQGFLRSRYRIGIFFGGYKISNIFSVCLIFLFFKGWGGG